MYGLTKRSYEELLQILSSVPEIEEVLLYGSRARGDYGPGSDIDLSLRGAGLTRHSLRRLNTLLYESHIPYFFDTNIYTAIKNPDFKANVDRDAKVIYQR